MIFMGDNVNYIRRNKDGIEINNESGSKYINSSLKKYINHLCMKNLSTYDGRRLSISKILMENNNIPIYVNRDIFLYPIKSIRRYDTVFVNFNEVLSLKKLDNGYTSFIFTNLFEIKFKVSINKILKQHLRIEKINDYLNNQNYF